MSKYLFGLLLGLILGFVLHARLFVQVPPPEPSPTPLKLDSIQEVLDKDLTNYQTLTKIEEKNKESERIMSKIFIMLMADIALKISPEQKQYLEKLQSPPLASEPITATSGISDSAPIEPSPANQESIPIPVPEPQMIINKNLEKKLSYLTDEDQILKLLKNLTLQDFNSQTKNQLSPSPQQLESILGKFHGEIIFDNKKIEPWQISIDFDYKKINGKYTGHQSVQIQRANGGHSNENGNGTMQGVTALSKDSNALLISVDQNEHILQLYHLKELNELTGIVYHRNSVNNVSRVGIVILRK